MLTEITNIDDYDRTCICTKMAESHPDYDQYDIPEDDVRGANGLHAKPDNDLEQLRA
jgi:hypothetical protein